MSINVGDKVRVKKNGSKGSIEFYNSCAEASNGRDYLIITGFSGSSFYYCGYDPNGNRLGSCSGHYLVESDFELLAANKNNKNNMSIKDKFIGAFLKEPEKTFRKAGITDNEGFLTADGQTIFLTWLLKEHGDKFKTDVVDGLIEDEA